MQEILGSDVDAARLLEQGSAFEAWLRSGIPGASRMKAHRGPPGSAREVLAPISEREVVRAAMLPPASRSSRRIPVQPAGRADFKMDADSDDDA